MCDLVMKDKSYVNQADGREGSVWAQGLQGAGREGRKGQTRTGACRK